MLTKVATNWKQLGKNLEINENLLAIIETNNPHDCESCCSEMLSEWLDLTPNASWKILNNAIDKTQDELNEIPNVDESLNNAADKLPDTVEKLCTVTDRLPETVKKLDVVADKLPDTVERLCTAADRLPDVVKKLDAVTDKLPDTVEGKIVNQQCQEVNKFSEPVDRIQITEDASLDSFAGNCGNA